MRGFEYRLLDVSDQSLMLLEENLNVLADKGWVPMFPILDGTAIVLSRMRTINVNEVKKV